MTYGVTILRNTLALPITYSNNSATIDETTRTIEDFNEQNTALANGIIDGFARP